MNHRIILSLAAAACAAMLTIGAVSPAAAGCVPFSGRGIITNVARSGGQWHVAGYFYRNGVHWFSAPATTKKQVGQVVGLSGCIGDGKLLEKAKIR